MSTPQSARFYSAPPSMHHISMQYVWSPEAVVTLPNAQPVTGNWVPMQSGAGGGGGSAVGTFTPNFNLITSSQIIIPVGVKSASITVVSGNAFIAGRGPIPAGFSQTFGGYDGRFTMSTSMAVGTTGGLVAVNYEV